MPTRSTADAVAATRRFNRFYTAHLRLLDRGHLQSPHPLSEVRLLYELAHRDRTTARELSATTGIDPAQLSRSLDRLGRRGLVRSSVGADRRSRPLCLTAKGRRTFAALDARADAQVAALLASVAPSDREELLDCLAGVEALLSPPGQRSAEAKVVLRAVRPGDLGWVVERHGAVYAAEYGWDLSFEFLVAEIVGGFRGHVEGSREHAWIATVDGRRAGCVFLTRKSDTIAKLRLLLVEPWARGLGLGSRLVRACIDGARARGYRRMTLWTNSVLDAARHIYEREGFTRIDESAHHSFGADLIGQTWERDLVGDARTARSRLSREEARRSAAG